ncbi:BNR-Asp box repeat-containing protein [Algoriphagus alkaliphilus]|uniref:BNR-Asp box repeat-containing protein n=1 Tax=Algoriphagus alkaliphilus TaxID=279824 RepID=A0A1G5ZJ63_9BACT|nr:glycosyl hydrolase [Algoriphagus alkaliphilus]MBA4300425.1 glycosyl hydrolase [Cyclobacterium sp.]SDA94834.1 BNR-Asp box repeat-containing protein [Algoriphagus alkaliphilus]
MQKSSSLLLLAAGLISFGSLQAQDIKPTTEKALQESVDKHKAMLASTPLHNFKARNVGPTNMSGRIVDIEVAQDINTYYVAAASGGIWKTEDNGQSFNPIFDHQGALGIGAMALSPSDNNILWVGTGEDNSSRSTYAGAGVYKSTDAGKTWQMMGLVHSHHIGQILIHPTNPEIVWVGSMGALYSKNKERGLYKTTDGGKTWKKTLYIDDNTGIIDIQIHPTNPDVLLAASWERFRQAHDFIGNGKGSSIWRSEDGGNTWKKAVVGFPQDEFTGRIGFDFSRSNPSVVYALLDNQAKSEKPADPPRQRGNQQQEENPLKLEDFKDMTLDQALALDDKKLESLARRSQFSSKYTPAEIKRLLKTGKITTAQIANYNGGAVDANAAMFGQPIIGAEVYRSEDAGKSWRKVSESDISQLYNSYGYYFGEIRVSTSDENEVFVLGVPLLVSRDGGKNFSRTDSIGRPHSDHQAMWINPQDSKHILLGNDGGLYRSYGGGARWDHMNTQMPISQFYSVMVDQATPYHIYGGMQDNGVWFGKSTNKPEDLWEPLFGGDGMVVAVDTRNNDIVYTGSQFGNYARINKKTGERKRITPGHDIGNAPNRWNWRTPAELSYHNQDIVYMGSQYVYQSFDQGNTWTTISPDLTKNKKSGNVPFATLSVVEESQLEFGTLYAGSDDGNVWVTRNNGGNWTSLNAGLPQDRWVSSISPSRYKEGRVYITLNGYRYDEFNTYVFKSEDYGKTWKSIKANLPEESTNIIIEDPKMPNILYLGTDHGLYVSMDEGNNWNLFQGEIPNVAIYDMVIQERENHLIVGSHGRSVYLVDLKQIHDLAQPGPMVMEK